MAMSREPWRAFSPEFSLLASAWRDRDHRLCTDCLLASGHASRLCGPNLFDEHFLQGFEFFCAPPWPASSPFESLASTFKTGLGGLGVSLRGFGPSLRQGNLQLQLPALCPCPGLTAVFLAAFHVVNLFVVAAGVVKSQPAAGYAT